MSPDVETPLLLKDEREEVGASSSKRLSSPSSSSHIGRYLAVATVMATVMLVIAYKGVVSDVAGIATTQLASALTFHVATATIDAIAPVAEADLEQEHIELEQRHTATLKMISDKKIMSDIAATTSSNPDALPASHRMMSLVGATPESAFNMCASDYLTGEFLNVKVNPGCISLFNNDVSSSHTSKVISFCGCENIGPKKYDFVSLQKASLIGKRGNGMISFIATGPGASVTLYNSANFDSEIKKVIGPSTQVSLIRVAMGESNWDNSVYSIVMQAWTSCDLVNLNILIFIVINCF